MFHGDENIWYEDENVNCAWNLNYYNHIKLLACTYQKVYLAQVEPYHLLLLSLLRRNLLTTFILHYCHHDVG